MILTDLIKYAQGMDAPADVFVWLERRNKQGMLVDQQEIEHIIDFFKSEDAPKNFVRMSYEAAHRKSQEWVAKMNKKGAEIEESKDDVKVILDFEDGFKIVQLIGENAYEREGFLMRHCVASYYGREVEVFSLRDANNMPHCTIERDVQIKGKGNGGVHPKYIDYVVRFLEWSGMQVRDSEMGNLGYFVPDFLGRCTSRLYRDRYLREGVQPQYQEGFVVFDTIDEVKNFNGRKCGLRGDVVAGTGSTIKLHKLVEVTGDVVAYQGAMLELPKLEKAGNVVAYQGATLEPLKLEKAGDVVAGTGSTIKLHKLVEVTGDVVAYQGATLELPKLVEVAGDVRAFEGATLELPKLEKAGDVWAFEGATLELPKLVEVASDIWAHEGATVYAPNFKLAQK